MYSTHFFAQLCADPESAVLVVAVPPGSLNLRATTISLTVCQCHSVSLFLASGGECAADTRRVVVPIHSSGKEVNIHIALAIPTFRVLSESEILLQATQPQILPSKGPYPKMETSSMTQLSHVTTTGQAMTG